jgi:tRNA(Ile)-lysidine synthase
MPSAATEQPADRPRATRLERDFARVLGRECAGSERVLVAVSGGRDSCVLLDLFVRCAEVRGLTLHVAHVHHGLRGDAADRDAAHVAALAEAAGLPFQLERIDPRALRQRGPSRERPTLEEAARSLRRSALLRMADASGCLRIATAHHAGDQAETLLLRLLRGTGPDGLAGMAPQSADGRWWKPLLAISPDRVAAHARSRRLVWREDASNADPAFSRNRVRHTLLPLLTSQFNPAVLRALAELAEAARVDRVWLDELVEQAARDRVAWRDPVLHFAIAGWQGLPEALARRLVRRGLIEAGLGREVSRSSLMRVLAFLRRGRRAGRDKRVELPGGFVLRRVEDHFELSATAPMQGAGDKVEGEPGC